MVVSTRSLSRTDVERIVYVVVAFTAVEIVASVLYGLFDASHGIVDKAYALVKYGYPLDVLLPVAVDSVSDSVLGSAQVVMVWEVADGVHLSPIETGALLLSYTVAATVVVIVARRAHRELNGGAP